MTSGNNNLEVIHLRKIDLYILVIFILFLLAGCRSRNSQEVKLEKKEMAPPTLVSVARKIQEILTTAEEVEKLIDGTYLEEKSLREERQKSDQSRSSSEKTSSQGSSGEGQGGNQNQETNQGNENKPESLEEKNKEEEEKRQEKIIQNWQSMSKKIKSVHEDWNSYETEEKKGSISLEKIDQFRNSINNLTKSIEEKDVMKVYEYGSQSFLNLSPMFDLYKDDLGGEVNKIKHGVYLAYLRFVEDRILQGTNILKQLENSINNIKLKIGEDKDKIKIVDKINAAIEDMEKAMKEDSLKLIRIKRDIIIDNLMDLEK